MNPHRILNVDRRATKPDIIKAAALAMRERKYAVRDVAIAQKTLLNPISNEVYEFLDFIDVKPLQDRLNLSRQESQPARSLTYHQPESPGNRP